MENSQDGISGVIEFSADMTRKSFAKWLEEEIAARGWTQAELARRAHVAPAQVNRVLTSERGAGYEFYRGVAKALNVALEEVYRRAGLLPTTAGRDDVAELLSRLDSLQPVIRERLLRVWQANLDLAAGLSSEVEDMKELNQLLGKFPAARFAELRAIVLAWSVQDSDSTDGGHQDNPDEPQVSNG